jgi:hypothetical protein
MDHFLVRIKEKLSDLYKRIPRMLHFFYYLHVLTSPHHGKGIADAFGGEYRAKMKNTVKSFD